MYMWIYTAVAMDTHIHEQLCVVEDVEESLLSEVAAGCRQVTMPRLQRGIQRLEVTFDLRYLSRLERWHPEMVDKQLSGAPL